MSAPLRGAPALQIRTESIAPTQRQRSASARRQRVRMESLERSIRQIQSSPCTGGSTRPRNSASRWKDRASSQVPAVANTPRRQRGCAAPCCSPIQTSFCEQTSCRSLYLAVRWRAPLPSLTLGICGISAWITFMHASLSSAFLFLRQVVISSALGMNALHSLNTSGVHARRCSSVPCEKQAAGETVVYSNTSDTHDRAKDIGRSGTHLFWPSMFMKVFMAELDTLLPERALVAKRQHL
jgi:hypothetical protein